MNEDLILIATTKATNERGFEELVRGEEIEIFAEEISMGYSEFFQADSAGYKGLVKLKIYKSDYEGQQLVRYKGKEYRVIRTYKLKGDYMEISIAESAGKDGRDIRLR